MFQLFFGKLKNAAGIPLELEVQGTLRTQERDGAQWGGAAAERKQSELALPVQEIA